MRELSATLGTGHEIHTHISSGGHGVGTAVFSNIKISTVPVYQGEYEFTPTQAEQIVPIGGMTAAQNIVINPIPSNYGLITYNGVSIRVS